MDDSDEAYGEPAGKKMAGKIPDMPFLCHDFYHFL